MHWFKNRPKTRPQKSNRPRVALNLSDLQLQDDENQTMTDEDSGEKTTGAEDDDDIDSTEPGEKTNGNASPSVEIASGTAVAADPVLSDPVILAFSQLSRNPFERSPYAQLVEQLRMESDIKDEPVEKKTVTVLNAEFSATIQTAKELVAVIDKRLFRKGELFQDKRITEIKTEYVSLETNNSIFLIPKTGVKIEVAEDGTYQVDDTFHKR
jgi:hypothetical protein